jgi:purine-binding chemotaxis protein CheW
MRPLPIEPLSGMPTIIWGLAIIRGVPTPVVDIGRLIGMVDLRPTRFVTVQTGGRAVALAVDSVLGVRPLPRDSLADVPPLLREANTEWVAAIGALDSELLLFLETARLVPDSVWREVESLGARS